MINDVVQAALVAIIPNTYQSVGDENITRPYCIHESTDVPEYLKEGLSGHEWTTEIGIIHDTADAAEALVETVKTAIEALAGTTSYNTTIESVEYQGSEPGFNEQTREYLKLIRFKIITKNR